MTGSSTRSATPAAEMQAGAPTEAAWSPWSDLTEQLENARRSILAEIRSYPPPIAACDQQFNHLLEQRERIAEELSRLAALQGENAAKEAEVAALVKFIGTSDHIPPELKARLADRLNLRLAAS